MIDFDMSFGPDMGAEIVRYFQAVNNVPFYNSVAGIIERAQEMQFETEGMFLGGRGPGSFGYKWFDLAPSTKESRKRINKWPGKILNVTNMLAASVTVQAVGSTVIVGTAMEYAPYLHYGTERMPPRPIFSTTLPESVLEEIEDAFIQNWK